MRSFQCQRCGQLVFFENTECLHCGTPLGFASERGELVPVELPRHRRCLNIFLAGCNWLVANGDPADLCPSCRLTRTRPEDADTSAAEAFRAAETAKRRLVFQLHELALPIISRAEDPDRGLAFDLLSSRHQPVRTGHEDGVITLDLSESDDSHREHIRRELGEPYRSVLGHLRHEIGHYYWPLLVDRQDQVKGFRLLFGDERSDYAQALDEHYRQGPALVWEDAYLSGYATTHPSEDWAETFAHYLHIRDTLQTANAYGIRMSVPAAPTPAKLTPDSDAAAFETILDEWTPLSYALNGVNRSMGKADLYPFILSPAVVKKLGFVHEASPAASCAAITASPPWPPWPGTPCPSSRTRPRSSARLRATPRPATWSAWARRTSVRSVPTWPCSRASASKSS